MKDGAKSSSFSVKRDRAFVLAGLFIFVNPVFGIVDILPDALGCLLIFFGLTRLAFLDSNFESARKVLVYLLVAEIIKLFLTPSVAGSNISSDRLLAATAFSVIEAICFIAFVKTFFGGLDSYSTKESCMKTLGLTQNSAFLTYLFFAVRLVSTVIPEIYSIFELDLSNTVETEAEAEFLTDLISTKPILTVLLAIITVALGVMWLFSVFKTVFTFFAESGESIDRLYVSEYKSIPLRVRSRRLKLGIGLLFVSSIFVFDISVDNNRILPFSVMFLLLFAAAFILAPISRFENTKRFSLPAFALLAVTEIYRYYFVIPDAVVINETPFTVVCVSALLSVSASAACLICVRGFLCDLSRFSVDLGGKAIDFRKHWYCFAALIAVWAETLTLPYLARFLSMPRTVLSVGFVLLLGYTLIVLLDDEKERTEMLK